MDQWKCSKRQLLLLLSQGLECKRRSRRRRRRRHDDSTFTGIIVKVDAGSKLILKEVRIEDGKKLLGPQFFQLSEIKELNLEDCEDDSEKKYSIPTRVNNKTLHKKIQQRHLSKRS